MMRRRWRARRRQGGRAAARRLFPRSTHAVDLARRRIALLGVPRSAGEASSDLEARFIARCRELDAPSVLELGTKQSVPGRSTMHRDWVPHAAEFLGTDFEDGADVDILADVHRLSRVVGEERFDIILVLDVRAPEVPDRGRP